MSHQLSLPLDDAPIYQPTHREIPPEECGVVGVFGHPEAAKMTYLGLYAVQHRGQESAGIVSSDGESLECYKGAGLVNDVFNAKVLENLSGSMAIGHVRYSTTGSSRAANAQPLLVNYRGGNLAIAHNGNLVNGAELRRELEAKGAIFQTTTDSEALVHMIAQAPTDDFLEGLVSTLKRVEGAYSLLFLRENQMVAVKDPHGIRPLCIGTLDGATVVASESVALDIMGAQLLCEVKPGEMLVIDETGVRIETPFPPVPEQFCIFEYIYYSRPDSVSLGKTVYEIRHRFGERLAEEHPVEADLVIAVPDSSNAAALGYAKAAGIPYELGLIRSHYIGRTFIEPSQGIRNFGVKLKFNPVRGILEDKRVVVVDDSIVRGTTFRKICDMIRKAGAREIHMRITAPPWVNPCYYGIDTPDREELVANQLKTQKEYCDYFGCDSIGHISPEGLLAVAPRTHGYCTACFTGKYCAGRPEKFTKDITEKPSIKR